MSDAGADPTHARYVKSYAVRRAFRDAIQHPPDVAGVEEAIDVHCHAHQGQQDPIALARHASRAGMGGLLFKTLDFSVEPTVKLGEIRDAVARWADAERVAPTGCWAGLVTDRWMGGPTRATVEPRLRAGVRAVWMPTASHANTFSQVGGRTMWLGESGDRQTLAGPMPMAEARARGALYVLKDGRLDPGVVDVVRCCVEHDAALFFGHLTHDEQDALAEEIQRQGLRKAVVDHPFSPFVDLSVERMRRFAEAGIYMNFTYDELSPLLGVDPFAMYQAIRAVGCHRVTLSSDAGEPLFPNSVECMRLMRAYMRAFGLTAEEVHQVTVTNPRYLLGLA
jgi:hypothetical protein